MFDIPRPAVLLIRGHELHLTTFLLFLYNNSSQIQQAHSNFRTLTFEHSDKGAVTFRFPAFLRFTLSGTRCCLPRTQGLQRSTFAPWPCYVLHQLSSELVSCACPGQEAVQYWLGLPSLFMTPPLMSKVRRSEHQAVQSPQ